MKKDYDGRRNNGGNKNAGRKPVPVGLRKIAIPLTFYYYQEEIAAMGGIEEIRAAARKSVKSLEKS